MTVSWSSVPLKEAEVSKQQHKKKSKKKKNDKKKWENRFWPEAKGGG